MVARVSSADILLSPTTTKPFSLQYRFGSLIAGNVERVVRPIARLYIHHQRQSQRVQTGQHHFELGLIATVLGFARSKQSLDSMI